MGRAGGWNGVTLGVTLPAPRAPHFALIFCVNIVKAFGQCRRSHFRKWNGRQWIDKTNESTGTVDHYRDDGSIEPVELITGQQRVAGGAVILENGRCTRLGDALGRLGGVLEASWGRLEASWGRLGCVFGAS